MTANYTRVRSDHERMDSHNNGRIIKCIVIPAAILAQREHNFLAELRTPLISENHEPVWGSVTARYSARLIQLNHYRSKSREEYRLRTQRDARWKVRRVSVAYDENIVTFPGPTEHNLTIQRFVPALKAALGITE